MPMIKSIIYLVLITKNMVHLTTLNLRATHCFSQALYFLLLYPILYNTQSYFQANMHSGFAAYDSMRRAEAYRHPLEAQDPLALQHPLAVQSANNDQQVISLGPKQIHFQSRLLLLTNLILLNAYFDVKPSVGTNKRQSGGFICAYHPAVQGSNLKHTTMLFRLLSHFVLHLQFYSEKDKNKQKEARFGSH